jgi:hypothetical protein
MVTAADGRCAVGRRVAGTEGLVGLETIAELSLALAGFSSLLVVFRGGAIHSWHPRARMAFSILLSYSLGALIFALIPSLLQDLGSTSWFGPMLTLAAFHASGVALSLRRPLRLTKAGVPTTNTISWVLGSSRALESRDFRGATGRGVPSGRDRGIHRCRTRVGALRGLRCRSARGESRRHHPLKRRPPIARRIVGTSSSYSRSSGVASRSARNDRFAKIGPEELLCLPTRGPPADGGPAHGLEPTGGTGTVDLLLMTNHPAELVVFGDGQLAVEAALPVIWRGGASRASAMRGGKASVFPTSRRSL